jgi:murein DD-endopeptidase MepM/ murein hydrolase activator NlpD
LTDLWRLGSARFPQPTGFDLHASEVAAWLRDRRNALLAAIAAVGVLASLGLGAAYVDHERSAAQARAAREDRANGDLQDALAQLRDEVGATSQALRQAQGQIAALSQQVKQQAALSQETATWKTDQIAELAGALDKSQQELHLTEAQRATLMARLSMAETKEARTQRAAADQWQQKLEALAADRDRAARERDALRARLDALRQKLSLSRSPSAGRSLAERQAVPAGRVAASPGAAHQRQVAVVMPGRAAPIVARERPALSREAQAQLVPRAAVATGHLAEIERVLASAGVDVKRMFADFGNRSGLGGPFVPMSRDAMAANHVSAVRLAALPGLLKSLPTGAPMYNYRETSPFGERADPFNGRPAFHPGVDLAAPYGTPVYATAAGVVTFAGWSGGYGKIVEISHGDGIVTRYGHLSRYIVLVGEHVEKGAQIGYEGSTGRSTGPHVIYEIDVNGEPQNPAKFMSLARLLPAAAR